MKKNRMAVAILLVMVMLIGMMTTAFAADYTPVDPDDQGQTGIVGGDTLTFSEDTVWANLTARWGVRVIFQDGDEWNNAELQNELLPVSDSATGSTTAPADPSHEGWTFTGWERVDTTNGTSTLNDDGTVTGINGPGPIIYQAKYEPVPPAVGNLTVSKTISGNAASSTKAFTFTVTLSDTTISGELGGMTFENGVATFTLKGGESMTAEGLPAGVSYIVAESDNSGYEVTKTGDTGTIEADATATAAFTNTKNSTPTEDPDDPPVVVETGSLTISKTVTGTDGDTEKAFTFTVTFGDNGTYSYTGSKSGTIASGSSIQLKHGESITISGIPAGTSYMVAESDNEGYEVTKSGDTGTITANATAEASFTNKKDASTPTEDPDDPPTDPDTPPTPSDPPSDPGTPDKPSGPKTPDKPSEPATPKTGDDSNIALWISLLLASFIGMMACIVLFRKKRAGKHMRTFMMLLLVGVMAFSCFGATTAFAAEDGTTGYTYGQYDMTYLPGTTDNVTNMPENETGLTPGADSPYTVASTVPVREGFEFIDWELTWGTMETSSTPVDYSDALTVSKTAASATGAELDRSFTITLEATVNINADDPSGLYVEDLTVTDTIEDEFVLNSVRAEILDSTGSVLSTETVSAGGPTVTHNFGNVQHGQTARLTLEVTAQPDFIGSNGVYTNVGLSGWTYKHTDPEATAAEEYSVTCNDKPQVNVRVIPITVTAGECTTRMGLLGVVYVHFSDPAGDPIPNAKYDQTRGTWSDVTAKIIMPAVTEDKPDENWRPGETIETITTTNNGGYAQIRWSVPTNTRLGYYKVPVEITFTADGGPENSCTSYGYGWIQIVPRQAEIEIIE